MLCLIVEEDKDLASAFGECLSGMGHEVTVVHSVPAAIHALRHRKYDLLLLEYMLNGMTAEQIWDYAAASCPNCRIILLTRVAVFPNGESKIYAPAIDWVLRKPITMTDLSAFVDYAALDAIRNPVPGTQTVAG